MIYLAIVVYLVAAFLARDWLIDLSRARAARREEERLAAQCGPHFCDEEEGE